MDSFDIERERLRHGAAGDSAAKSARIAESVASTFQRLAATYRRMADRADSPDKKARLRGHVTRLEDRADRERADAHRFRAPSKPVGRSPSALDGPTTRPRRPLAVSTPVEWTGGDLDCVAMHLFIGHPGRIAHDSSDPVMCATGKDVRVSWYQRPDETETGWHSTDISVLTEAEFDKRVTRMNRGLQPLAAS